MVSVNKVETTHAEIQTGETEIAIFEITKIATIAGEATTTATTIAATKGTQSHLGSRGRRLSLWVRTIFQPFDYSGQTTSGGLQVRILNRRGLRFLKLVFSEMCAMFSYLRVDP